MNKKKLCVCFDVRPLQMGHESRGIGMHMRSVLENLPQDREIDYFLYAFDSFDPIEKNDIKILVPYTLIQTPALKKSIDSPRDFIHLAQIIWHRFKPLSVYSIDVFIQFDFMLGLPRSPGVKNILYAYDLIPLLYKKDYLPSPLCAFRQSHGPYTKFKRAFRALYYRLRYALHYRNFQRADTVLSISSATTKSLTTILKLSTDKVVTNPLAPVLRTGSAKKPIQLEAVKLPYILYIGATDSRKRVQDLVYAYTKTRERDALALILAGKEFESVSKIPNKAIYDAIKDSAYAGDIHAVGYVSDEEKLWLYQNATAFVFPTEHEGFGLPILEAMQNGCSVISYDNSSVPEVAGDAAILVKTGDIRSLSESIHAIATNASLRNRLRKNGRVQAAKFTWHKHVSEIMKSVRAVSRV